MQALNIALFHWLSAGFEPDARVLWFAGLVAERTTWICVALIGWAAWRRNQWPYLIGTLAAAAAAGLAAHALANAIGMPRPFMIGLSPAHIEHGARGSLPSAHATVMFTVGLVFCLRAALRKTGLAILALALLTGWGRIYVGVHFPFDILAGLLLAAVMAALFWGLERLCRRFVAPRFARDDLRA